MAFATLGAPVLRTIALPMFRLRLSLLTLLLALGISAQVVHGCSHISDHAAAECKLCLHAQVAHPNPVVPLAAPLFALLPLSLSAAPLVVTAVAPLRRWLARAPPAPARPATLI